MSASLLIQVRFEAGRLCAIASVCFSAPRLGDMTFSLAESLALTAVQGDGKPLDFFGGPTYQPQFQSRSRTVTVRVPGELSRLDIRYEGSISGAVNLISPELRAVSFYSAWYPFSCPELPENAVIEVSAGPGDFLLKGRYNSERGVWIYDEASLFDPFNLILIDRNRCFLTEAEGVRVCCREKREIPAAKGIAAVFQDILDYYYTDLYRRSETVQEVSVPPMDIVSLSAPGLGGAYFRRGLIVMDCIREDENKSAALLAHELGHTWGDGAGWDWEDWLNETVAEWSCLCYLLERRGRAAFLEELRALTKDCPRFPPIRSADGSRPQEGVHEMGTALFYGIFREHGLPAVKQALRVFASLPAEERRTAHYADALRQTCGDGISDRILRSLDSTDYVKELDFLAE